MQDRLAALLADAAAELPAISARPEFEAAKARYVGPSGRLTALMREMGAVPREQRPLIGKLIRRTPGFRHLLAAKSTKQKRRASKDKLVADGHAKPLKACLPFGL